MHNNNDTETLFYNNKVKSLNLLSKSQENKNKIYEYIYGNLK